MALLQDSIITLSPAGRDGLLAFECDAIGPLVARTDSSAWEQLRVEARDNGSICLKFANFQGTFLTPRPDGHVETHHLAPIEDFDVIRLESGKIALQSQYGGFLGVHADNPEDVPVGFQEIGPETTFVVRKRGDDCEFTIQEDPVFDDGAIITLALADNDARIGMKGCYAGEGMRATAHVDQEWERFRVVLKDNGRISLAVDCNSNLYWTAEPDGAVSTNRPAAFEWEEFTVIPVEGGAALQSCHGGCLGVNAETGEVRFDWPGDAPEAVFLISKQNEAGVFEPMTL